MLAIADPVVQSSSDVVPVSFSSETGPENGVAPSNSRPPDPPPPEKRVLSEAQIKANRANARKSTGPRTPPGKARASQNALVHGLRAASLLAPGEDPRDLIAYRDAIIRCTNPRNPIEMEYTEQVIRAGWKLRRYQAAEIEAMELQVAELAKQGRKECGSGVLLAHMLADKRFQALSRYEQHYTRMMNRALDELRKLKKDPIYGILGNFAGEMLEEEKGHLEEVEAADEQASDSGEAVEPDAAELQAHSEPTGTAAPNEPNSDERITTHAPASPCEPFDGDPESFNDVKAYLEMHLVGDRPEAEPERAASLK